jgi:hypothetical protein
MEGSNSTGSEINETGGFRMDSYLRTGTSECGKEFHKILGPS